MSWEYVSVCSSDGGSGGESVGVRVCWSVGCVCNTGGVSL